jgi:DNA relaxase NicK
LAKATSAENIIGGAEAILKCVEWSATSDFKNILGGTKNVGGKKKKAEEANRGVQNAIRFYDKMIQAQLVHLLSCARVGFPKGLLDSSSKMIKLMEKARKHPC